MRLYHYATWIGQAVHKDGKLKPSDMYGFGERTALTTWVPLVFLTESPDWERSIQAVSPEGHYEKCGSCPQTYTQMGIPCYKFVVDIESPWLAPACEATLLTIPNWKDMIKDAIDLTSDVARWWIFPREVKIEESFIWRNETWDPIS